MKFKKEFLLSVLDNSSIGVSDDIVDHGRWAVTHRIVFKHDGRFYESHYSVGATENQDESPCEYCDDAIECAEVFPVQVTVYRRDEMKP